MAFDFYAISSQGVFVTPTPTGALRSALNSSQGLLNITLPAPPEGVNDIFAWGRNIWGRLAWGIKKWS